MRRFFPKTTFKWWQMFVIFLTLGGMEKILPGAAIASLLLMIVLQLDELTRRLTER